jgi:hypothetical protein
MKIKACLTMLITLAAVFLTACQAAATPLAISPTGMPDIGIPVEQLNKDIMLQAPKPWNEFKTRSSLFFLVYPISKRIITFTDRDSKTFLFDDGKWIELKNVANYGTSEITHILDTSKPDGLNGTIIVDVDLPEPKKPALLRVFLFGYVYENGAKTDEKVASYIDVNLKP